MQDSLGVILVLITSILTYAATKKFMIRDATSLRRAIHTLLECLGAASMFLVVNVALGIVLVLAIRSVTPLFVSVYLLNDLLLIVLSVLQGFVFQLWWRAD